jgi:phosphoribosylamine---glycine ligase
VRFGDPETQVVLPLLAAPLTEVLAGTAEPTLLPGAAVTVVVAAHGYPVSSRAGDEIRGLAAAAAVPGVSILHSGTALDADGRLVTTGGRALSVTAVGADLGAARQSAYQAAGLIEIPGAHYRTDIALAAATGQAAEGTGT